MSAFKKLFYRESHSKSFRRLKDAPESVSNDPSANSIEHKDYIDRLELENIKLKKQLSTSIVESKTISFQLGKVLIDVLNRDSSGKKLPAELLKIYVESRKRKVQYLGNASLLDKLVILFNDEKLLKEYRLTDKRLIEVSPAKATLSEPVFEQLINSYELESSPKYELEINSKSTIKMFSDKDSLFNSTGEAVELASLRLSNETIEIAELNISSPNQALEIFATTVYKLESDISIRKAAVLIALYDSKGNIIEEIDGIGISAMFAQHYRYLNANAKSIQDASKSILKFKLPVDVKVVKISVVGIRLEKNDNIEVRLLAQLHEVTNQEHDELSSTLNFLPASNTKGINRKRYTADLKVACILDEFTAECLSHEFNMINVTQEAWQLELEQVHPDFLLVESCWKGNSGNWGTLTKGSGGGKKLSPLLAYCKSRGIPTVFWNKEDPPHYDKFGAIARLFDVAITTDINMIPRYKKDFGIEVHPLSFGAQPKIHNPFPAIQKLDKAVFAGSYYNDKPKRCFDFDKVIARVENAGVKYDIFDRNYNRDINKFIFPERYQASIIGNLSPSEVWKAHKGYKYQINMNSVQNSSTMFARRVYESLASGTPVISNDSVGVRELFGDLVIMDNDKTTISEQLRVLEASPEMYQRTARQGVRRIMRSHTYGHRIKQLCKLIGINVEVSLPEATLAVTANSEADVRRAKNIIEMQTAVRKHLFVELDNFPNAHTYLNESNDNITYAMNLGRQFYQSDEKYYQHSNVLKCNAKDKLAPEALEDFLYWGAI